MFTMVILRLLIAFYLALWLGLLAAHGQPPVCRTWDAPAARAHDTTDHGYDLTHIALHLDVDYPHLVFRGVVVNTLTPLREGLASVDFHCGENLRVEGCEIAGRKATFTRDKEVLRIAPPAPLIR